MGMDTDGTVHDVTIVFCSCAVGFPACIFTAWHGVVLGMRRSRRVIGTGWGSASFIRKLARYVAGRSEGLEKGVEVRLDESQLENNGKTEAQ